jgi:GAF domain-containing protein/ligand-binding sensor protein
MGSNDQISDQHIAMWQRIVDTIAQITGFASHIINLDGSEVTGAPERCILCNMIRSTEKGRELCDKDNTNNAKMAVDAWCSVQYLCHSGQVNYAIPIQIAGQRRICLIGEHILVEPPNLDKYRELAEYIGIPPDKLLEAASNLPVKPSRTHEESKVIIENLLTKIEELVALNEIARIINEILWLPEKLDFTLDTALDLLNSSLGLIQLVDEDEGTLRIGAKRSLYEDDEAKELEIGQGITGWVAKTGEAALVNNVHEDPRYAVFSDVVKSELAVPMKYEGKVIGVLDIESTELNAFGDNDKELLMAFAEQAAVAIGNAQLFEEVQRLKAIEQIGFQEVYDAISRNSELDGVLDLIMRKASQLLHFDYGCILLIEKNKLVIEKDELVTRCSYNLTAAEQTWRTPVGEGITGWVAANRKPLYTPDVRKEVRYIEVEKGVLSELAVPLTFLEDVLGVFDINSTSIDAFSEENVRQLSLFADQAAMAIGIAQLLDIQRRETASAYMHAEKLQRLWQMNQSMVRSDNIREILSLAADIVTDTLDAEACSIFLYDSRNGKVVLREAKGLPMKMIGVAIYRLGEGLIDNIVSTRRSVNLGGGIPVPQWAGVYAENLKRNIPSHDIKAVLLAPVLWEDKVFGVVGAINKRAVDDEARPVFTEQDQQTLETLCGQIAVAVRHAERLTNG